MNTSTKERRIEVELEELGGTTPDPHAADRILATLDDDAENLTTRPERRSRLWVAAAVLLGSLAVAVASWSARSEQGADIDATPPAQEQPIHVEDPESLPKVRADARILAIDWLADPQLVHLSRFRELREIRIHRGASSPQLASESAIFLTDDVWATLATLPKLEHVHVGLAPQVHGRGIGEFERLPMLRRLSLWGIALDAAAAPELERLTMLDSLSLSQCAVDQQWIQACARLPGLRRLGIETTSQLSPKDWHVLAETQSIRELSLLAPSIDSSVVRAVADLPLTKLGLGGCEPRQVHDADRTIAKIPTLTDLNLRFGKNLPDRWFATLAALPKLRQLGYIRVGASHVETLSRETLANIAALPHLRSLALTSQFLNAELWPTQGFAQLEHLDLRSTMRVGDLDLGWLPPEIRILQ